MSESPAEGRRRGLLLAALVALCLVGLLLWVAEAPPNDPSSDVRRGRLVRPAGGEPSLEGRPRPQTVPPHTSVPDVPAPELRLTVRVLRADTKEPVPGVLVEVRDFPIRSDTRHGSPRRMRSDADGYVTVEDVDTCLAAVTDADWMAVDGAKHAVAGREVVVEVVPRPRHRISLVDAETGQPLVDWFLAAPGAWSGDFDQPNLRTDESGCVEIPEGLSPCTVFVVGDGASRMDAFFLYGRDAGPMRLELPPVAHSTRIRVVDFEGRPISPGSVHVGYEDCPVWVPLDENGQALVRHGEVGLYVVAVAPGFAGRSVGLGGQEFVEVALCRLGKRTFQARSPEGAAVPPGTMLQGRCQGPTVYGDDASWFRFEAQVPPSGMVTVAGLPAAPFRATVYLSGPGTDTVQSVQAGGPGDDPIRLVVGPHRVVAFELRRALPGSGRTEPWSGPVWTRSVAGPVDERERDAAEQIMWIAEGRGSVRGRDEVALARGPVAAIRIPEAGGVWTVDLYYPEVGYAAVAFAPGPRPERVGVVLRPLEPLDEAGRVPLVLRRPDGLLAVFVDVEIQRDTASAPVLHRVPDSSGTFWMTVEPGLHLLRATDIEDGSAVGEAKVHLTGESGQVVHLRPAQPR